MTLGKPRAWMGALGAVLVACGSPDRPAAAPRTPDPALTPFRGNPFEGAAFAVDPAYAAKVESSVAAHPAIAASLRKVGSFPTAVWLDSIAKARNAARTLDDALGRAKAGSPPALTVFVLYDVPGRDCAAVASAGEIDLASGVSAYASQFVDLVAAQFRGHPSQRIAVIVEPDSLANLATNLDIPKCKAAESTYIGSVAYAVRTLATIPNVAVYLDAAHAGWLGWDGNRAKIAHIFRHVLDLAGGVDKVRGFSTNVSNFNTLADGDAKRMEPSTPCPDELTYVEKLTASLAEVGITGKGFVIDTSRNGRGETRAKWSVWCNVRGAGLGERPRASPVPGVDAYFWVKPPGESDGGSIAGAPGYDAACATDASAARAPAAGRWFDAYFVELVRNANPPL